MTEEEPDPGAETLEQQRAKTLGIRKHLAPKIDVEEPEIWIAARPNIQLKLTVDGYHVSDAIHEHVQNVLEAYIYELKRHLKGLRP